MLKFILSPRGNHALKVAHDTYLSFNARAPSSDSGSPETALVINGAFYILNGDYRQQYEEALENGGEVACIELFLSEKQYISSWSDGDIKFLEKRLKDLKKLVDA